MAKRVFKSITEQNNTTSFKDTFKAMKSISGFFSEIYQISPALFITNIVARLINAFSTVLILWTGKLIIDEVILQLSLDERNLH